METMISKIAIVCLSYAFLILNLRRFLRGQKKWKKFIDFVIILQHRNILAGWYDCSFHHPSSYKSLYALYANLYLQWTVLKFAWMSEKERSASRWGWSSSGRPESFPLTLGLSPLYWQCIVLQISCAGERARGGWGGGVRWSSARPVSCPAPHHHGADRPRP